MKVETTHNGSISLKITEENGETKTSISLNFKTIGKDYHHLVPALHDFLKVVHKEYSLISQNGKY